MVLFIELYAFRPCGCYVHFTRWADVQLYAQTSKNRLTAPPSVAAPPAILSSRDRSVAGYS